MRKQWEEDAWVSSAARDCDSSCQLTTALRNTDSALTLSGKLRRAARLGVQRERERSREGVREVRERRHREIKV